MKLNSETHISKIDLEEVLFQKVHALALEKGIEVYVIGGYVRDQILGRPTKDIDFVCVGSGIELANMVAHACDPNIKVSVFKRFGTAMFKWQGLELEFVGARKESYHFDSRKPVVEDGSIQDDQNRRDFTINALAISLNEDYGQLIDPFEGLKDLELNCLRTPLEPEKTFSDDPLRMMRAIRFATQLNFRIDDNTFDAIRTQKDRINIISKERIADELNKIVLSPKPSIGFKLLEESGILAIILPEIQQLKGVDIIDGKGHKDNFYHTIEVLDNLARKTDKLWLRWSAILHDVAKPATKRFHKELGWTFHGHEVLGAKWVPRIFKRLKLPLDHKMKYVQKLVRLHLRPISLTKENISDSAIRRLLFDAGDDLEDLLLLCEADITSKNPNRVQRYKANYQLVRERLKVVEEKDRIRNWKPPIDGDIIMRTFGIGPSKPVGVLKTAIREAILDGKIANQYDPAFEYMMKIGQEMGLSPQEN